MVKLCSVSYTQHYKDQLELIKLITLLMKYSGPPRMLAVGTVQVDNSLDKMLMLLEDEPSSVRGF